MNGTQVGCPFIAGPACWDCDGSCWHLGAGPPEPTADQYCEGMGHPLAAERDGFAQCYCGARLEATS